MKTLKVDDYNRIRLPGVQPRQVFSYEPADGGAIMLRPVVIDEPRMAKVRFEKRGRYTVGVLDRPIDEAALAKALEEFP